MLITLVGLLAAYKLAPRQLRMPLTFLILAISVAICVLKGGPPGGGL